jgi:transcriptional regulator with XRE-family HTH domain
MGKLSSDLDRRVRTIVAGRLRALRIAAGITQAEVSRRTRIFRPIICRTERGLHTSGLETCARYAAACGADLADVLRAVDRELGLRTPRRPRVAARAARPAEARAA